MGSAVLSRTDAADFEFDDQGSPLRILLGEENRELGRLLTFILLRDGHEVVGCESEAELRDTMAGTRAAEAARPIDLVISEHSLPCISGLSFLAAVRGGDCFLPFILIAANPRVQAEARRLGAVVLVPPPTVKELRSAIRRARNGLAGRLATGATGGGDCHDRSGATTSWGAS
jgi:CheY-like chemotaxis protein